MELSSQQIVCRNAIRCSNAVRVWLGEGQIYAAIWNWNVNYPPFLHLSPDRIAHHLLQVQYGNGCTSTYMYQLARPARAYGTRLLESRSQTLLGTRLHDLRSIYSWWAGLIKRLLGCLANNHVREAIFEAICHPHNGGCVPE